jgi:hypothetical protein
MAYLARRFNRRDAWLKGVNPRRLPEAAPMKRQN